MRRLRVTILLLLAALLVAEAVVRLLGLADVPIRAANATVGYIPLPSQSGRFLRNDWTINGLSMISSREYHDRGDELILVGDSVVFGGNPLAQRQRVGERLDVLMAQPVYAIADGSWSLKNELRYLLESEAVTRPHSLVFVLNSADFGAPSSWRCASTHPLARPLSHAYFVFRKYVSLDCEAQTPPALVVGDFSAEQALNELLDRLPDTSVRFFLYPDREQFARRETLIALVADFAQVANGRIEVAELLDYAGQVEWSDSAYLDGIHPSPQGAAALAHALSLFIARPPVSVSPASPSTAGAPIR